MVVGALEPLGAPELPDEDPYPAGVVVEVMVEVMVVWIVLVTVKVDVPLVYGAVELEPTG